MLDPYRVALPYLKSREVRSKLNIPADSSKWPSSWSAIEFKIFNRFPRTTLPEPKEISVSLTDALQKRQSCRKFIRESISLEEISALLGHSLRVREKTSQRPYPSGGGRYSVETHILVQNCSGLSTGFYYYHPKEHSLYLTLPLSEIPSISAPWTRDASCIILFSALWERSSRKYQELALPLILIEAGHMAQNILLATEAMGFGACPLAAFDDEVAEYLLDENPETESTLYIIPIGNKARDKGANNPDL